MRVSFREFPFHEVRNSQILAGQTVRAVCFPNFLPKLGQGTRKAPAADVNTLFEIKEVGFAALARPGPYPRGERITRFGRADSLKIAPLTETAPFPEDTLFSKTAILPEAAPLPKTATLPEAAPFPKTAIHLKVATLPEDALFPENTFFPEDAPLPETATLPEDAPVLETAHLPKAALLPENAPPTEAAPLPENAPVPETALITETAPLPETATFPEIALPPEVLDLRIVARGAIFNTFFIAFERIELCLCVSFHLLQIQIVFSNHHCFFQRANNHVFVSRLLERTLPCFLRLALAAAFRKRLEFQS